MIISFMGEYRSGKDYLCDFLVKNYGAHRLSFSDEVRRLAVKIFPWLPFDFDPSVKDLPFDHPQNPNGLTPRDIWLLVGKVRDVTPNYFVDSFVYNQLTRVDENKLNIITDFRTPQEWEFLKKYSIPVIKIQREDRSGIGPNAFEEFVRQFREYDALFINRMDGTESFEKFFKDFLEKV